MPDTFTAKQVASRIGTDAKTLRKFLRSNASPYEAVGQGGRYEFPKTDLAAIQKAFKAWQQGKRPTTTPAPEKKVDPDSARRTREMQGKTDMEVIDEILETEGDPSDAELDAIQDEELEID